MSLDINQKIDKAQAEASAIKTQGIKTYLWNRPVKMSLAWFLISIAVAFVGGAILL